MLHKSFHYRLFPQNGLISRISWRFFGLSLLADFLCFSFFPQLFILMSLDQGYIWGEREPCLNGHTLIAGKHFTGCYTGDFNCMGTSSGHKGNTSKTMVTKKGHHSIRQAVIFERAPNSPLQSKILRTPLW